MSSGFLVQSGLVLLRSSHSFLTSLTFFFFFSFFFSSFSSLISTSPSFFSVWASSFLASSSASSSEISFSVVFSTSNYIGKAMNSECFLTKSFNLLSSKNSKLSCFKYKITLEPLLSCSGLPVSSVTLKVPPA